jgi:hypothetical protein
MKCLCGSRNCRGVIGGTQEGGAAARAAIEAAVEVPEDEEDPDYIMVTGGRCWEESRRSRGRKQENNWVGRA